LRLGIFLNGNAPSPYQDENLTLLTRANLSAPDIAIDYWRLAPNAKMIDVLYAVRSDETTHRFVNHSLANLDHSKDVNPFAFREPDMFVKGKKTS
jgi:ubiquinol oxidase